VSTDAKTPVGQNKFKIIGKEISRSGKGEKGGFALRVPGGRVHGVRSVVPVMTALRMEGREGLFWGQSGVPLLWWFSWGGSRENH
jgi:hypothetical protein